MSESIWTQLEVSVFGVKGQLRLIVENQHSARTCTGVREGTAALFIENDGIVLREVKLALLGVKTLLQTEEVFMVQQPDSSKCNTNAVLTLGNRIVVLPDLNNGSNSQITQGHGKETLL